MPQSTACTGDCKREERGRESSFKTHQKRVNASDVCGKPERVPGRLLGVFRSGSRTLESDHNELRR